MLQGAEAHLRETQERRVHAEEEVRTTRLQKCSLGAAYENGRWLRMMVLEQPTSNSLPFLWQVHALRMELERTRGLLAQADGKLCDLAAAQDELSAVRLALAQCQLDFQAADVVLPASLDCVEVPPKGAGAAVACLVQQLCSLRLQAARQEQQLCEAAAAMAAAVQQAPSPAAQQHQVVQCEAAMQLASAAVQVSQQAAAGLQSAAVQTDVLEVDSMVAVGLPMDVSVDADGYYGRAGPHQQLQQQHVAHLMAQLVDARLAEVSATADLAASNLKQS